jgi:transitional endoplasmic reticulum ATPase
MNSGDENISSLREALRVSPNNLPIRQLLADSLLGMGRAAEAEQEYRAALGLSPNNGKLMASLARAFYQQGKHSEALVIVEALAKGGDCPPRAQLLFARLLVQAGEMDRAQTQYEKALEGDASLADAELAKQFGTVVPPAQTDRPVWVPDDQRVASREGPDDPEAVEGEIERPKVDFKDVGGMESVKEEIRMKIIHPLTNPQLYEAYGKTIGGGILLYGAPGCGKTHLARATAGEIKAGFMSVGINDVLDMWLGKSERNLHALFEQARRNQPCVMFFDEVDALAANRADLRRSAGRHVINQFLSELDGVDSNNKGVLILAATNAPWHLDSAFRRPGRFDRILFVPPPDVMARAAILRILVKGKPIADVDFEQIAKKAEGFSGADLKGLVDVAVEGKLREAMKSGVPAPLTTRDLLGAAGSIKQSTREWFSSAKNYALYANQGGVYDDILKYLKAH